MSIDEKAMNAIALKALFQGISKEAVFAIIRDYEAAKAPITEQPEWRCPDCCLRPCVCKIGPDAQQPDDMPVFKGREHALFLTQKAKEYLSENPPVDWLKKIRQEIHYPECWDTAAYPTLFHAIYEQVGCSQCKTGTPQMRESGVAKKDDHE